MKFAVLVYAITKNTYIALTHFSLSPYLLQLFIVLLKPVCLFTQAEVALLEAGVLRHQHLILLPQFLQLIGGPFSPGGVLELFSQGGYQLLLLIKLVSLHSRVM